MAEGRDFRPEGKPAARPIQSRAGLAVASHTMRIHDADTTAPSSVLVVDDEPQVVWVLQFSLEAEGYTTYAANNGVEALAEITEHRPNLMVLDIMMPTMDGWSVLEEMMKLPREQRPRVVIVSALSSVRDRAKAAELGADAYVPKPFNVDELLAVLHGLERAS
jgi:DNA-binding response OmpR family regulator